MKFIFTLTVSIYGLILSCSGNTDLNIFKTVKKRYDIDMQTCVENFDIHADNIIRTQDSVAMGAKYINELDLGSREECLRLCCETVNCDVFVFEEKSPGSCYLFHCGTPDNFKCQFTKHFNYTSAVLTVTKHLTELETQIKFTKHEQELSRLRRPGSGESTEIPTSPAAPTLPKMPSQLVPSVSHNSTQGRRCSRYQFECHNSGECIAIYNACDGIPQCADGSDEAVELDCPSGQGFISTSAPVATARSPLEVKPVPYQHSPDREHPPPSLEYHNQQNWQQESPSQQQYLGNEDTNRYQGNRKVLPMNSQGHPQLTEEEILQHEKQHPGTFQHSQNGREYSHNWQQAQYHGQGSRQYEDQGSHIFNHKNNGLMAETDRYSARFSYLGDKEPSGPIESPRNEYKYGGNAPPNGYYQSNNSPFQPPRGNSWQQQQQQHSHHDFPGDGNNGKGVPDSYGSQQFPSPDYYYDDNQENVRYHNQIPNYQHNKPQVSPPHLEGRVELDEKMKQNLAAVSNPSEIKPETELKRRKGMIDVHVLTGETTTVNTSAANTSPPSGKKEESNEFKDKKLVVSLIEDEVPGNPSGAILSLALGVSILSVFVGLIACRLRVVRRHLRRGGKSPYAHDADYLVNGMYL